MEFINKNIDVLEIENIHQFKMKLPFFNIDDRKILSLSSRDLLQLFIAKIQNIINDNDSVEGYFFSKNYLPIKIFRDKVISHRERIIISDIYIPTWDGIKELQLS